MLISYLTYTRFYIPCYCIRWFACNGYLGGGVLPCMANTGMCRRPERCQSTEARHKRAINKRHFISTNRNIHPYIIQIRTPGKLSFLDLITNRSTKHRTCLTRNLRRSNSGFCILANLIRRRPVKIQNVIYYK